MKISLSLLSVILGVVVALPQILGLINPARFMAAARAFPRNETAGRILIAISTAWFLFNLRQESISDFAAFKPYMYAGFAFLGLASCFVLRDFLAVRGLALVLLLVAKLMVDTARWHPSPWRLVIAFWAYALVIAGMWFTVSPWRMRDFVHWMTASESRVRVGSGVRLLFALVVIALGVAVY
jgi:hypothetical protein